MTVYEGSANHNGRVFPVNIIDTMGFCDSTFSEQEVVMLLKHFLKVQMTHIDKVVVVVSGRIEQAHVRSIRQILDWLDFQNHPFNFVFVYNKADQCRNLATIERNISAMIGQLETGGKKMGLKSSSGTRTLDYNMALGIPPGAPWEESKEKMAKLARAVFVTGTRNKQRIPVDPAKGCAIC
jgi:hypothetical protein